MNLKDIKGIVDLMKKNAISEFEMEEADFKIKLKRDSGKARGSGTHVTQEAAPVMFPASNATIPASPAPAPVAVAALESAQEGPEVKSPMIGTFYRKPSPEADSYVEVGSMVEQFLLEEDKASFIADFPRNITPTTDDRPYFFNFTKCTIINKY